MWSPQRPEDMALLHLNHVQMVNPALRRLPSYCSRQLQLHGHLLVFDPIQVLLERLQQ
jgi:hypothetical protein